MSSPSTSPLIFLTGGTGFIGAHTILAFLRANYRLRLTIRHPSQAALLASRYPTYKTSISTILMPDFSDAEALKQALDGVQYVIHLATPMPGSGTDFRKDFVEPAVSVTVAVLSAAKVVRGIEKVLVMSSSLALLPVDALARGGEVFDVKDNTGETIPVDFDTEFPPGLLGQIVRYAASKIVAHQATRDFVKDHKPGYALVTLHPVYVMGHDLTLDKAQSQSLGGINGLFWASLFSEQPLLGTACVHVQDVAEAQVRAIQSDVGDGKEFLLSGPESSWEEIVGYIQKKYPDLELKLRPPFEGRWNVDVTAAETILGQTWRSKEAIIDEVIGQQFALQSKHL
ncbi:NAD(P)-binding protein [Lophiostoma macrostomum CBS 122681]|uniref:NAD(P)-binding protein n=1 Tax=Lophiostoma macrostomum CBS 122681 TaxID=1314788 RepID=A0A6A6TFV4_9PLEO|nr:NAD(P)-binding protein [Lophiostoma macrostomum CBS 122681]